MTHWKISDKNSSKEDPHKEILERMKSQGIEFVRLSVDTIAILDKNGKPCMIEKLVNMDEVGSY
jgi:hypothetical protein